MVSGGLRVLLLQLEGRRCVRVGKVRCCLLPWKWFICRSALRYPTEVGADRMIFLCLRECVMTLLWSAGVMTDYALP